MPQRRARVAAVALLLGASMLFPHTRAWAGPPPTSATAEQSAEATRLYAAGVDHYKAGRLAEALAQFKASYDVVASPNSHLMVARVLKDQGALVEAYTEYRATESEALALAPGEPKYQASADTAKQAATELSDKIAFVTVKVLRGSLESLEIGGKAVDPARMGDPTPVALGRVEIVGTTIEGKVVTKQLEIAAPGTTEAVLEVLPAPPPPEPTAPPPEAESSGVSLVPFIITGAVLGAGGFAVFGAFGAMNDATFSDLEAACPNDRCPADQQGAIDDGKTQQLVANIGLGVGAVGMAAAATFLIVELASSGSDAPATEGKTAISIGPGSVTFKGTF